MRGPYGMVVGGAVSGLFAVLACGLPLSAHAEWDKSYHETFVSECVRSSTSLEGARASRTCECMAREMETQVSQDDMEKLSQSSESKEQVNKMMPFLKVAKTRCEGTAK